VAPRLVRAVGQHLQWDRVTLWLADDSTGRLQPAATWAPEAHRPGAVGQPPQKAAPPGHSGLAVQVFVRGVARGVLECLGANAPEAEGGVLETLDTISTYLAHYLQRRQDEQALAASEARKAAILEAALDAVITFDADGAIRECNPAAGALFGCAPEGLLG